LGQRMALLTQLKQKGILAVFHYVPLHNSPAGLKYGRVSGIMTNTEQLSDRLVRLPIGAKITLQEAGYISSLVLQILTEQ